MVIVYKSNTGFTQEYAEMLAKAEKLKVCSLPEAADKLEAGAEVFYMGPLMAGHISGIDQAVKRYAVKGVCGVGMSPAAKQTLETIAKANYVPGAPIFYLQGGWAPQKVSWIKRRMVGMVTKSTRERLRDKGSRRTAEEQSYYDLLVKGGSCVAFEKLDIIRAWMKEQR